MNDACLMEPFAMDDGHWALDNACLVELAAGRRWSENLFMAEWGGCIFRGNGTKRTHYLVSKGCNGFIKKSQAFGR